MIAIGQPHQLEIPWCQGLGIIQSSFGQSLHQPLERPGKDFFVLFETCNNLLRAAEGAIIPKSIRL